MGCYCHRFNRRPRLLVVLLRAGLTERHIQRVRLRDIEVPQFLNFRVSDRVDEELYGLAESIRKYGVFQPVLLRPVHSHLQFDENAGHEFELITGRRRYAACKELGLDSIPAFVMRLSDQDAFEVALVENIQRKNLNPIEEAEAFKSYVMNFGRGSITHLARKIGKSEEYVSHRLLLLGLPKVITDRISKHKLNPSVATELVWIKNPSIQVELAESIEKYQLSFKQVRITSKLLKSSDISVRSAIREARKMTERGSTGREPGEARDQSSPADPWPVYESDEDSNVAGESDALARAELILRACLVGLDFLVQKMNNSPHVLKFLMKERYEVHGTLDEIINAKVSFRRKKDAWGKDTTKNSN